MSEPLLELTREQATELDALLRYSYISPTAYPHVHRLLGRIDAHLKQAKEEPCQPAPNA